ncbi:hypothetical protein [Aliivibrio logei]|uniref:Outer membrane protease n=1 Tax=Aliivibrio logei TaxID=688 RepID=A0A1B9P0K1_ALILO|nr:hypothetical protein [Aliivibrio logei]OCH21888.1 hypothetical protein A6E04_08490 [Aliivibrio logei]
MRINACTVVILGLAATAIALPLSARTWVEVGSEYEEYFNEIDESGKEHLYEQLTAYVPYIRFSHSPNSNEWNIWGRYFKKEYINADLFPNEITSMTERAEMHYTQSDRFGAWRFRSGVGVRYNGYDIDRYEVEYRVYPQVDYFINPTNQLFTNGHVYLGQARGKRSMDSQAEDYVDWGYEYEFGLIHRINTTSSIKPHFYTEFDSFENNYDIDYWQFRLVYTQKVGRVTINPFVRIGLGRNIIERSHYDPERWGIELDKNYSRAGVFGNVGISGKLNLVYETYWQEEKNSYYDGGSGTVKALPYRNKFFAKLGMQYVF